MGNERVRGLTIFIFNVYNMRKLKGDGDDDKQPVYVIYIYYKCRGITAYIY